MSEKTLWGLWRDGYGWAVDSEGRLFSYFDPRIASDCRDRLQDEQQLTQGLVVRKMDAASEQKTLWGLWFIGEHSQRWYLDYFRRPCFSYDRRLVAAHVAAHSGDGSTYQVKAVGDDGQPVDDEPGDLAKTLEEDAHFLASDEPALAMHPGVAEMTSRPGENARSMWQLTLAFLTLPYHARELICNDLGLPMDGGSTDGIERFIPAFRAAHQGGTVDALRRSVEAAAP